MNIKRYDINESMARLAQQMNSFNDYTENSETNYYQSLVEKFENAVNDMIEKNKATQYPATDEQMESIEYYSDRYAKKLADAINRENIIETMCPSILISGGGNFPVRKKEKQNNAREKHYKETHKLKYPTDNYYYNKISNILTNTTIYSNDEFAIEKLQNELADAETQQTEWKKENAYYRKNNTMKGYEDITDEEAEKLDKKIEESYSWMRQPCPSCILTSNNAKIKRIRERIEEITKLKENAEKPPEEKYPKVDGIEVVENAEAMRIQLIFSGKPEEATRIILKSKGFKWSPKFGAWQRQLTSNGIYATKQVLNQLKTI